MNYRTLQEFDAAARAFLGDAAHRYRQLADAMTGLAKHETAAVFRQLESMQRDALQTIPDMPDPGDAAGVFRDALWVGGDDEYLPRDIADSVYSLTPVRAINLALHNNRRALRYLINVLARTGDTGIRALADELYRVFFDQIACLRLERRRARRRRKGSGLAEELTRLRGAKTDIEYYRRERDICLGRLRGQLTLIARATTGEERDTMLALADTIAPSAPSDTTKTTGPSIEGGAIVQAIAAVEEVFDALLLTAQRSEEETVFRLAQTDAGKLLPAMRRLHEMVDPR